MPNEKHDSKEGERAVKAEARPYLEWAEGQVIPDWLLAAAVHKANWPEGQEVSEADFKAALNDANAEVIV